jgi:hypothetical protein
VRASGWVYIEPYDGDITAALTGARRREFARLFRPGAYPDDFLPGERRYATLDALDHLWTLDDGFGTEGTHTILDVWEVVDPAALDDHNTVRPLTKVERLEIFGTSVPSRADYERAQRRYDARRPGAESLWEMPRWSGWCQPLRDGAGVPTLIAFWGMTGG